ncbi:glycine betaine ABC transporter substrate-binding protein [Candidatus Oscillochloris fontis]|uniref:glycine betaine ABC transporter substrate-binding protein n=1 Tax=Candidatus Oscillochloris fontis TaxID=2496868 RepID=UPI001EE8A583|nr:glycine betaine ABC transporter substrate-binding protein [Candidatus Oscillochloris fontis]
MLRRTTQLMTLALVVILTACGQAAPVAPTTAPAASPAAENPTPAAESPTVASTPAAENPTAVTEPTAAPSGATIRIGSKHFTEAILVAEMYALMLEENGFTVERKFSLGATAIAHEALVGGDIDLYPEYTSTGLQVVLKQPALPDEAAIMAALRKGYEEQFQVTWLNPSPFNNTNVFALTKEKAEELGVVTFSDLVAVSADVRLGGPPEFPEREDNKAILAMYGFDPKFSGDNYVQLDSGSLRYEALTRGDVDVVVAFGTDGQIAGLGLTVLQDDKNAYPIYQIAPVIRQDALNANPQIAEILNAMAPLLTSEVMSGLNWQVDGPEKKEVSVVAREFLVSQGVIK